MKVICESMITGAYFRVEITLNVKIQVISTEDILVFPSNNDVPKLKQIQEQIPELFRFDFYTEGGVEKCILKLNTKKYNYLFDSML